MSTLTRRQFAALAGAATTLPSFAQVAGQRPARVEGVKVENPRTRVPVGMMIDDSTCLVNLAHFCIPQFQEVFPSRYTQDWRSMPREIPDSFVRRFGEWCLEHGVKGKYSIVPNPACVGWMDREVPGWTKRQLTDSLDLVRKVITPNWDIHPEMITHTWVIDTKTGRPYEERSERYMENFGWSAGKSVDELTDYLSYALRILKNAGLHCEGLTTPGGFGGRALPQLAQATLESCRDVHGTEIPHYFRHAFLDDRSVAPRVEYASGLDGSDPRCVVSIIGCTNDWFGGWDAVVPGEVDKLVTPDLKGGRMLEVIRRGEPAIMYCHWPGIYFNGTESGFQILQETVRRMHAVHDNLIWMKLSELARYWAAKELTAMSVEASRIKFRAPFACPEFTLRIVRRGPANVPPVLHVGNQQVKLSEVAGPLKLKGGTWTRQQQDVIACFDLPKGQSYLV
ncbi:MAG: hypothetical protein JNL98_32045 [Bryobacterales bacterium]|nr:hypothetical protein [Bryobacterales bacterium]